MIVVDASALLEVLVGRPDPALPVRLAEADVLHAPHLLDTEVLHALRRLVGSGRLALAEAEDARRHLAALAIDRYPHHPLTDRVWSLRGNLSAYDATYVALAAELGATLVTADARLAAATGLPAPVELHG